jgi:hypothetical protein
MWNENHVHLLVILEVETHTRQVYKWLDASLAEFLRVTNTRALENEWRAEGPARYNDLLTCLDDARRQLSVGKVLGWDDLDTNCAVAFENDLSYVSM